MPPFKAYIKKEWTGSPLSLYWVLHRWHYRAGILDRCYFKFYTDARNSLTWYHNTPEKAQIAYYLGNTYLAKCDCGEYLHGTLGKYVGNALACPVCT